MVAFLKMFWQDDQGQDLVEYTLLLAFVCLASAALFINVGASLGTIWTDANSIANQAALCAATSVS
jgi:Flp pilus assembly pilin Flp